MEKRRKTERRTGAVFLVLIAATNVVAWMELVASAQLGGEVASSSEIRLALASCFLAAALMMAAWLVGRRVPARERLSPSKARLVGLRLAILSVVLNLALVGAVLLQETPPFRGPLSQLPLLSLVWYVFLLPVQLATGFAMGRSSQGGGRRGASPSPAPAEPTDR